MKHVIYGLIFVASAVIGYVQSSDAKPNYQSINQPGQQIDLASHFVPGKTNIFYFYADWCGACRKWSDTIEGINQQIPDMKVHCVDIDSWGSPVTQQFGIQSVPNFHVFDDRGRLLARDREGRVWLSAELERRARARGLAVR